MKPPRRRFLQLVVGAAVLPAAPRIAMAQIYPSRPVTMLVPYGAGGATDTTGRIVAEGMRVPLGQPVIIENVVGAPARSASAAWHGRCQTVTRSSSAGLPHTF
jgi:tripartite-type tricarboxylate transporter receptor subunit TctC